MPPHWLVYFQVDDCDASVEKAKSLGVKVTMGPQGAHFYLIKLTGLAH